MVDLPVKRDAHELRRAQKRIVFQDRLGRPRTSQRQGNAMTEQQAIVNHQLGMRIPWKSYDGAVIRTHSTDNTLAVTELTRRLAPHRDASRAGIDPPSAIHQKPAISDLQSRRWRMAN